MNEEKYKSLLIVNESRDAQVTLYLYPRWDFVCWLSFETKKINPNAKYLYRSENRFKFRLVARFDDKRPKKTFVELEEWVEDKLLKISESLSLTEGKLADFPEEKAICLPKLQRNKELKSTIGGRNLYEILGLDMDQVRKMPKEEQLKAIKKGFRREIQRWHPDRNLGDDEKAKEVIMAYEILRDGEKRACYHNMADYDKGWLSLKRYKAIFKPECFSKGQKQAYRIRMAKLALSVGIAMGGIAACAVTAGFLTPLLIPAGLFSPFSMAPAVLTHAALGLAFNQTTVMWRKDFTLKQVLGPAECGAGVDAVAWIGVPEVVCAILEGEVGEQIVMPTGARRLGNTPAWNIPRAPVMSTNIINVTKKVKRKIKNHKLGCSCEDESKVCFQKKRRTSGKDSVNEHLNNLQQNKCSFQSLDIVMIY